MFWCRRHAGTLREIIYCFIEGEQCVPMIEKTKRMHPSNNRKSHLLNPSVYKQSLFGVSVLRSHKWVLKYSVFFSLPQWCVLISVHDVSLLARRPSLACHRNYNALRFLHTSANVLCAVIRIISPRRHQSRNMLGVSQQMEYAQLSGFYPQG